MEHCFNKNINNKWYRIFATQDDINIAKEETVQIFDQGITILDVYIEQRKTEGKRELTTEEKQLLLSLLTSHYVYRLETLIDRKIEDKTINENKKVENKKIENKNEDIIKKYDDVEF
ncbi:MAG: hypothetical protein IJ880_16470 [Bacilli bacterium]|nr:hypothetical protein [Bacilli bacterium]